MWARETWKLGWSWRMALGVWGVDTQVGPETLDKHFCVFLKSCIYTHLPCCLFVLSLPPCPPSYYPPPASFYLSLFSPHLPHLPLSLSLSHFPSLRPTTERYTNTLLSAKKTTFSPIVKLHGRRPLPCQPRQTTEVCTRESTCFCHFFLVSLKVYREEV